MCLSCYCIKEPSSIIFAEIGAFFEPNSNVIACARAHSIDFYAINTDYSLDLVETSELNGTILNGCRIHGPDFPVDRLAVLTSDFCLVLLWFENSEIRTQRINKIRKDGVEDHGIPQLIHYFNNIVVVSVYPDTINIITLFPQVCLSEIRLETIKPIDISNLDSVLCILVSPNELYTIDNVLDVANEFKVGYANSKLVLQQNEENSKYFFTRSSVLLNNYDSIKILNKDGDICRFSINEISMKNSQGKVINKIFDINGSYAVSFEHGLFYLMDNNGVLKYFGNISNIQDVIDMNNGKLFVLRNRMPPMILDKTTKSIVETDTKYCGLQSHFVFDHTIRNKDQLLVVHSSNPTKFTRIGEGISFDQSISIPGSYERAFYSNGVFLASQPNCSMIIEGDIKGLITNQSTIAFGYSNGTYIQVCPKEIKAIKDTFETSINGISVQHASIYGNKVAFSETNSQLLKIFVVDGDFSEVVQLNTNAEVSSLLLSNNILFYSTWQSPRIFAYSMEKNELLSEICVGKNDEHFVIRSMCYNDSVLWAGTTKGYLYVMSFTGSFSYIDHSNIQTLPTYLCSFKNKMIVGAELPGYACINQGKIDFYPFTGIKTSWIYPKDEKLIILTKDGIKIENIPKSSMTELSTVRLGGNIQCIAKINETSLVFISSSSNSQLRHYNIYNSEDNLLNSLGGSINYISINGFRISDHQYIAITGNRLQDDSGVLIIYETNGENTHLIKEISYKWTAICAVQCENRLIVSVGSSLYLYSLTLSIDQRLEIKEIKSIDGLMQNVGLNVSNNRLLYLDIFRSAAIFSIFHNDLIVEAQDNVPKGVVAGCFTEKGIIIGDSLGSIYYQEKPEKQKYLETKSKFSIGEYISSISTFRSLPTESCIVSTLDGGIHFLAFIPQQYVSILSKIQEDIYFKLEGESIHSSRYKSLISFQYIEPFSSFIDLQIIEQSFFLLSDQDMIETYYITEEILENIKTIVRASANHLIE